MDGPTNPGTAGVIPFPQPGGFPQGPVQIQLPAPLIEIMQQWPALQSRFNELAQRTGVVEAQIGPLPARLAAVEQQRERVAARDRGYLVLMGWSCFLAGILATLGAQFAWMHW